MAPDAILLERWVHHRDADAFAELVSRYSRLVYGTTRRILGNATDAEDVAQETFIDLATHGHAVKRSVGSWLHAAATHRALNHIRAGKRRAKREALYFKERASAGEVDWEDVWQHVDEAVDDLPVKLREPVVLRFIDGRTQDWIAREFDVAPATIRYRLDRGVEQIRRSLRSKGIGVGATALAAAMAGMESDAAPSTLTAALGRVALAGLGTHTPAKLAIMGCVAMTTKKAVLAVVVVVVLAGLGGLFLRAHKPPQTPVPMVGTPGKADDPTEPAAPAPVQKSATGQTAAAQQAPEEMPREEAAPAVPLASVSGLVENTAGEPVGGAAVHLEVLAGGEDLDVAKSYQTTTGADGRYRIAGVDTLERYKAEVSIYASAPGYLMAKLRRVEVERGKTTQADLRLKQAQFSVAGVVVAQDRAPLPGASVDLQFYGYNNKDVETMAATGAPAGNGAIGDPRFVFARTGDDGRFQIAIPADGYCDFTVRKEGYGPGFFPQIHTGTQDAVFVLRAPGALSGHVRNADGSPAPGIPVEVAGAGFPAGMTPYPVWIQPLRLKTLKTRSAEDGSYTVDGLGEQYWYRVAVPQPNLLGEERLLAQVLGVSVQAGQTTTGVDLTLPPEGKETAVFGIVTDIASGLPVYPSGVEVLPVEENPMTGLTGAAYSSVLPDGSFRIILNLLEECDIVCRHRYRTEGGSAWSAGEEQTFRIKPFEEVEANFSVAAPFEVDLEYVDEAGAPLPGIMAAVRTTEGGGGCGGSVVSDPQGSAVLHGLPPEISLTAMGWQRLEGDLIVIGSSEPFTGSAAQKLSGVRVVCRPVTGAGGVSGILVHADGRPVAQTPVYCRTVWAGSLLERVIAHSADDGSFTSDNSLPEGAYDVFGVGFEDVDGRIYGAILNDITIANGQITPLGPLTVAELPPE